MRKVLSLAGILAFGLLGVAAQSATTTPKKSTAKKSATTSTRKAAPRKASGTARTAAKRTSTTTSKTATSRRKKTTPTRRTAYRSRQLSPSPDRYKEIQDALAAKGYLTPEQANGRWDDTSTAALKKFQTDQNLDGNGKINSLSLIALGLGPKRDTVAAVKPASAVPAAPAPQPAADTTANP